MKEPKVAVLGGGRLAQVVCALLAGSKTPTKVFVRRQEARAALRAWLPKALVVDRVEEALEEANIVVLAVPADAVQDAAALVGPFARGDMVAIHACRGVGRACLLPHEAIRAETCIKKIVALGGPLYNEKQAADRPMVAVAASRFQEGVDAVRAITKGTPVMVHGVADVVGVELAGAVSNISALAVGMSDGLNLGETARGVLLTRGLSEATRLGVKLGAELGTFSGLAGVGDLIPRNVSSTRRHHDVGAAMAAGKGFDEAMAPVQGSVEGVLSARELAFRAEKVGMKLPLVQGVAAVLAGQAQVRDMLLALLRMDLELERETLAPQR